MFSIQYMHYQVIQMLQTQEIALKTSFYKFWMVPLCEKKVACEMSLKITDVSLGSNFPTDILQSYKNYGHLHSYKNGPLNNEQFKLIILILNHLPSPLPT